MRLSRNAPSVLFILNLTPPPRRYDSVLPKLRDELFKAIYFRFDPSAIAPGADKASTFQSMVHPL
jgi:hypothetical protein